MQTYPVEVEAHLRPTMDSFWQPTVRLQCRTNGV